MRLSLFKKGFMFAISLMAAITVLGSTAWAAEKLDQQNTNYMYNIYFGAAGAGQTFTAGTTGFLTKVSIPAQAFPQNCNTRCGNLTVEIYSGANVFSTPSTLLGTASIPFSSVSTTSLAWVDVTFSSPIAVTAGQHYLLHLPPSTASGISAFNAGFTTNSFYSGGNLVQSTAYNKTMINYPSYDLAFKTYVSDSAGDTVAPTTTDNAPSQLVNHDVAVQFTAADNENGSGVAATYYKIDGGQQQSGLTANVTGNGSHTLTYWSVDKAGNVEQAHTKTISIDSIAPTATIAYSTTDATNQDVTATITPSEAVTGETTHVFGENGTYTFEFTDAAGNKGTATATVNNIDKIAPTGTAAYSTTNATNQDVTATITPSEAVTITNNGGSASYTFTQNGSFTFEVVDAAGNAGTIKATVSNIDKAAPTIQVSVNPSVVKQGSAATATVTATVKVADNAGIASVRLVSVTDSTGDTDTVIGAELGSDDRTFSIVVEKAKKNGKGSAGGTGDRVYTVTYIVTDVAGNTATASAAIVVPHDNSSSSK